jgi:hypothetical protein
MHSLRTSVAIVVSLLVSLEWTFNIGLPLTSSIAGVLRVLWPSHLLAHCSFSLALAATLK